MARSDGSLPYWRDTHKALLVAGRNAQRDSLRLAQQLEAAAQPAAEVPVADSSQLPLALQQLRPLLSAANLDALPLFEALMRDHGLYQRPEYSALAGVIEQFNFSMAARECETLLARYCMSRPGLLGGRFV